MTAPLHLTVHRGAMSPGRVLATGSVEAERWWLPILGPAAVAMARLAVTSPQETITDPAAWLGVGAPVARNTARRLARFGWAAWLDADVLAVCQHQHLPSRAQADRLPELLRTALHATPTQEPTR